MREKLTDLKISKARPADKPYKLTDGAGLYLLVTLKGQKYWRLDYRFGGKRNTQALGVYPAVTLRQAREKSAAIRRSLDDGIDPSSAKRSSGPVSAVPTVAEVVAEWLSSQKAEWAPEHHEKIAGRFERHILPFIGNYAVREIQAPDLMPLVDQIVDRGTFETAYRVKQHLSALFRYAIRKRLRVNDPTQDLRGHLPTKRKQKHFGAITDPKQIGPFMRALDGYSGYFATRIALQLSALTMVRPGELRKALWGDMDLDAAEWRIPGGRMKMGRIHIIPLSRQAVALLKQLQPHTGSGIYVFPSARSALRPMSENTVCGALRRLGYTGDEMTAHGFRSMAATRLNEMGFNSDAVERQLAHAEQNKVRAAYVHAEYLDERRKMMQAWADYLDQQRSGASIVMLRSA